MIKKLSEYIMDQQNRTFAHVVRAGHQDPMKQMTVNDDLGIPGVQLCRVRRPRIPWVHANCKWLYETAHPDEEYNHALDEHKTWVKETCEAGW